MNFEPGKTYSTRSIGDHNCIISVTIAKRTAKSVTTTEGKTFRVSVYEGNEQIRPWGRYSMAPIIGADDPDLSKTIHPAIVEAAERDNREYDALLQTIGKAITERAPGVVYLADYRKAS
jgi:hypothetical protein